MGLGGVEGDGAARLYMIGLGFDLQIDGSLKDEDQLAAAVFVPVGVIGAAGLIGAVEKLVSRDRGEGDHAIVFGQAGLVAQGGHVRDPADIAQMGGGGVQQGVELDLQAVGYLPDGGDGGKGGDVIFVADPNINTLIDFKFKKLFKAQNGENGQKKQMYGKTGENLIIKVPVGTQVRDVETGKLLLDLNVAGEERVLLRGGKGGLGNVHFKSSIRKTPKIAGKGREGAELKVKLELKLIADVALVGYPSVGKSSFINRVSAANSKVGSYHFTTLEPKLGVVRLEEGKSFVIADIPGLIEGAHEGVGLGDKFLRHNREM